MKRTLKIIIPVLLVLALLVLVLLANLLVLGKVNTPRARMTA